MGQMLEVMRGRLGIAEIPGKKHNPVILGYFNDAGHPEVITDEEAWCSAAMCSAAKEADLPIPPVNINLMAKSWLTWGVAVEKSGKAIKEALAAGHDVIAIWPRGNPKGPYGHVNIVEELADYECSVVCIGGNQATGKGADAVTRSKPRRIEEALGFRRSVPATVPALREAGSTTIKQADNLEKVGIVTAFFTPIFEGIKHVFGPVEIPQFATLPEGLSWWQTVMGSANGILDYATAHPILAATIICGLGAWTIGQVQKRSRVAEHAAGIPIAAEVAALGAT